MPDFKVYTYARQSDAENDAFFETAGEYDIVIHDGWQGEWLVEARSESDLKDWIRDTGDSWGYDDDYFPA